LKNNTRTDPIHYQIVIAGFGGQGVVFLVKVLSTCAGNRDVPFLGTENHGMSQRGGAVSCDIKVGAFTNPVIDNAQADLLIGLDPNEALRNLHLLKKGGAVVSNADRPFPDLPFSVTLADGNAKALAGEFPIQGLNVYMLGVALAAVEDFPFGTEEVEAALRQINAKVADQNIAILRRAIADTRNGTLMTTMNTP
jgi:indolepyruvate ferredoxin oxidoreductase beta subunit